MNRQLANNSANNFSGITVSYSDKTNKFTFTCPHAYTLGWSANNTIKNCVGFLNGVIANSYTAQTGTSTTISTTLAGKIMSITLNQTYLFFKILQIIQERIQVFKFLRMLYILVQIYLQL